MKTFKKITAAVLTATLSICMTVDVSANGIYINTSKDPNHDGNLNIADIVYIIQCLNGKFKPSDLEQLDMNDNGVVNHIDAELIQLYDSGVIS